MDDPIFIEDKLPEWYDGGAISSAHNADSVQPFELPYSYVLFCYPRDNTPVCTGELIELQKGLKEFNIPVIAASTDSPESHNLFFNNEEAFPSDVVPNIEYPILTIKDHLLTKYGKELILNEFGYCRRIAVVVKQGKVSALYQTGNDDARKINILIGML